MTTINISLKKIIIIKTSLLLQMRNKDRNRNWTQLAIAFKVIICKRFLKIKKKLQIYIDLTNDNNSQSDYHGRY